jgi:hypothetical protein
MIPLGTFNVHKSLEIVFQFNLQVLQQFLEKYGVRQSRASTGKVE